MSLRTLRPGPRVLVAMCMVVNTGLSGCLDPANTGITGPDALAPPDVAADADPEEAGPADASDTGDTADVAAVPDADASDVADAVADFGSDGDSIWDSETDANDAISDALSEVEADAPGCVGAVITSNVSPPVLALTTLQLSGQSSTANGGPVSSYWWTLLSSPPGTSAVFLPSAAAPDVAYQLNVVGTYEFQLEVRDETNTPDACGPVTLTLNVEPHDGLYVELIWSTPGDADESDTGPEAGADLDLHLAHPLAAANGDDYWFHGFYDTYSLNASPNWGSFDPGVDDDPALFRDDTDGQGPEVIGLSNPEGETLYRIAVHYWNAHGFGPSTATVNVFWDKLLVGTATQALVDGDLWEVATINDGVFGPLAGPDGEALVTPDYPSPL